MGTDTNDTIIVMTRLNMIPRLFFSKDLRDPSWTWALIMPRALPSLSRRSFVSVSLFRYVVAGAKKENRSQTPKNRDESSMPDTSNSPQSGPYFSVSAHPHFLFGTFEVCAIGRSNPQENVYGFEKYHRYPFYQSMQCPLLTDTNLAAPALSLAIRRLCAPISRLGPIPASLIAVDEKPLRSKTCAESLPA